MKASPVWFALPLCAVLGLIGPRPAAGQDEGSSGESLDQLLNLPSNGSGSEDSDSDQSSESEGDAEGSEADPEQQPDSGDASDAGDAEPIEVPDEQSPGEFMKAIQDMKLAADHLTTRADPGIETQRVQERALRRLDQLIEQMRNQQQSSGGSSQQQQQQDGKSGQKARANAQTAAQQAGPQGRPQQGETDDQPLSENLSEWGNLPQRLRDQLLQGLEDRFSPLYRSLTERYYERLAEEAR
jgi:hypothetical protein